VIGRKSTFDWQFEYLFDRLHSMLSLRKGKDHRLASRSLNYYFKLLRFINIISTLLFRSSIPRKEADILALPKFLSLVWFWHS
jgi:hypothetical protein